MHRFEVWRRFERREPKKNEVEKLKSNKSRCTNDKQWIKEKSNCDNGIDCRGIQEKVFVLFHISPELERHRRRHDAWEASQKKQKSFTFI